MPKARKQNKVRSDPGVPPAIEHFLPPAGNSDKKRKNMSPAWNIFGKASFHLFLLA